MKFENSETKKNLKEALAAESVANSTYTFYSETAQEQGYHTLSDTFLRIANNERAHARIWFNILNEPRNNDTLNNLEDSACLEHHAWANMYKSFANTAREEGFVKIAELFDEVGEIEFNHNETFNKLALELKTNTLYEKPNVVSFRCDNCGHIDVSKTAPLVCPVCHYNRGYFEELCIEK